MKKVETFLGKDLEDRVHQTLVTLSKERARRQELDKRGVESMTPAWLDSAIYQLELMLADLEGSRIAAGALQATVEEVLDILANETYVSTAVMKIKERWKTLLRRSDEKG